MENRETCKRRNGGREKEKEKEKERETRKEPESEERQTNITRAGR